MDQFDGLLDKIHMVLTSLVKKDDLVGFVRGVQKRWVRGVQKRWLKKSTNIRTQYPHMCAYKMTFTVSLFHFHFPPNFDFSLQNLFGNPNPDNPSLLKLSPIPSSRRYSFTFSLSPSPSLYD